MRGWLNPGLLWDLELAGETTDNQGRRMKPDVVITQVQAPFDKTREVLDQLRAVELPLKVTVVTVFEDSALIRVVLTLEVVSYVLQSALSRQLLGVARPPVLA